MTNAMSALGFGAREVDDGVAYEVPYPIVTVLSEVQPEMVRWLWPGWLPLGKLVVLDGDPSLGKSTLSLTFAGVVTTGGTWPDGGVCEHPGGVVLLSAEDGLADTVRPRLDAAGADTTKVAAIEGVRIPAGDGKSTVRPLSLADVEHLRNTIERMNAKLMIIDVLMAFLPSGTDAHRDQDVRRILHRLVEVADSTRCTVLLLRHLNKARGGDPLYRGGGSIGIVGAARAGLLVATDPKDDTRRILASTKSNLGASPASLAYRLVDSPLHGCARVAWDGPSPYSSRDLLADPSDEEHRTEGDEVAKWLIGFLTERGGEAPAKEIYKAAKADDIAEATLRRARGRVDVSSEREGFGGGSIWRLPSFRSGSDQSDQVLGADRNERNGDRNEPAPSEVTRLCAVCHRVLDDALGNATTHPNCGSPEAEGPPLRPLASVPTPAVMPKRRPE